ncbi:MAG: ZPR1 zinc finger domain-containing protein [Candidatus Thalassarchaeaceae archaeon]|nr:ZPR1 zinc finger domain-containing protein [Candidatus Thalassarchaeaceae archaeon]
MESTIEQNCPICHSEAGLTLIVHNSEIPYFGEHTEMTLVCDSCGWRHTDFIPAEGKKASAWSMNISEKNHLNTRVVRSSSCTVRIVELGLEVEPGDNATGYISNIEGVLNRFEDAIGIILRSAMLEGEEEIDTVGACQELISKLNLIKNGEDIAEILLLDPMGHSQILHKDAKNWDLSDEEIASLETGPQIPVIDTSDLTE